MHISEISNRFVKNPAEVVKVHQKVLVTVLDVDLERRRIPLSMKDSGSDPMRFQRGRREKEEGEEAETEKHLYK